MSREDIARPDRIRCLAQKPIAGVAGRLLKIAAGLAFPLAVGKFKAT